METQRRKYDGMDYSQVYEHVKNIQGVDARRAYLWRVLSKKDLYLRSTEENVVSALESVYEHNRFQDYGKHLESRKEFCLELAERGYPQHATLKLKSLERDIIARIDDDPKPHQFGGYSSILGHGEFDREAYHMAYSNYQKSRTVLRIALDDVRSIEDKINPVIGLKKKQ